MKKKKNIFQLKLKAQNLNAISYYKKYTDKFGIDEVPQKEREEVGINVAKWVWAIAKEKLNN